MPFISWGYLLPYLLTVLKTSTLFSWTAHAMNYGPTSLWKSCNSVYATHSTDILLLFRSIINCIFRPQLSQKNMSLTRDERNSHPATIFGGQVTNTQQVFNPQHNPPTSSCKGEDTIWARAHWQPASYNYRNLSLKRKWPYSLHFRVKTLFFEFDSTQGVMLIKIFNELTLIHF